MTSTRRPRPLPRPTQPPEPIRPTGPDAPLLFTPAQAANKLGVRESWLRRRAGQGTIPCTRLGKHLRFSDADLVQIIRDASAPISSADRWRRTP